MSAVPSLWRRGTAHWPLALACAVFLLVGLVVGDDYFQPIDVAPQRTVGMAALDYLAGDGERAFDQLIYAHDRYYGAVVEAPLVLVERIPGLGDPGALRLSRLLLPHLFFVAGGVFCYLLTWRLFTNRALALLAMVLFLLHPRIYAHSFFNSKDVPFLVMFMISLYLVHRAFRRDTLAAFLLCGVGVGLLVNLRVMGIVLFAAVLALRALDLAFAGKHKGEGGVRSWRATAGTAGAFALTAILTYYASLPGLWTDPVGQGAELARTLSSHPIPGNNLFRGQWLYSPDGPPVDYVPVWVGITTPPATLLLTLIGGLALAWRGIRRPRDIPRNVPLRFGLLLLSLPIVTTVGVVVLENNINQAWRHLFFLYAPLLLLAAFGLHWLGASPRGRWLRMGAYALAVAAVAVTAVSMIRIHPHQNNHFNSFVDRTTPERLNSLYAVRYWRVAGWDLLRDIVRDHPSGDLFLSFDRLERSRATLPVDDRERIIETQDFRSGERNFYAIHTDGCSAPAPYAPVPYVSRVYATTLHCVVDPVAWFGFFRREALASGEPLVRSTYHIHRAGNELTYLRDGCPVEDVGKRFFLHVTPVAAADLPPGRAGIGFDNRDFPFGARIDGNCIATGGRLPDYPIASIRTGQFSDDGVHWEVEFTPVGRIIVPSTTDLARARREALAREPLARSIFNVHRDGRTLTYIRDGCTEEEAVARFFLHVEPLDPDDLPTHRREHGFDNLDFTFARSGARVDGNCIAVATLPDYPIGSVRTGQYDGTGAIWETEFSIPEGE